MSESMIYGQLADLLETGWSVVAVLLLGFVFLQACCLMGACILCSRETRRSGSRGGLR